jgi:hypothetical protein
VLKLAIEEGARGPSGARPERREPDIVLDAS